MKKSELIARYRHFGEDLVAIDNLEFFRVLADNDVKQGFDKIDLESDCTRFSIDGYDYYCYSSCYKVGWQGDMNADSFFFKIRVCTALERESIKQIFSRKNDYTVFEEVFIGGEDFRFDTEDLVAL
jgi:hypothetical protein